MEKTLFDNIVETTTIDRFHNSTDLQGDELQQRQLKAGTQNRKVLDFFKTRSYENYTPFEVWKSLGINNQPITSIRRAISDLTDMDYLVKTNVKRPGQYGEQCYCWMLK